MPISLQRMIDINNEYGGSSSYYFFTPSDFHWIWCTMDTSNSQCTQCVWRKGPQRAYLTYMLYWSFFQKTCLTPLICIDWLTIFLPLNKSSTNCVRSWCFLQCFVDYLTLISGNFVDFCNIRTQWAFGRQFLLFPWQSDPDWSIPGNFVPKTNHPCYRKSLGQIIQGWKCHRQINKADSILTKLLCVSVCGKYLKIRQSAQQLVLHELAA